MKESGASILDDNNDNMSFDSKLKDVYEIIKFYIGESANLRNKN